MLKIVKVKDRTVKEEQKAKIDIRDFANFRRITKKTNGD
jgi:hypothetical protein